MTENFRKTIDRYRALINERLSSLMDKNKPVSMYDAGRYVLGAGGKRIRPLLTMFSCESVGGTWKRALPSALAVEILHNFTLVHDDIMDNSDSRRGRPTVHNKWDSNVAILVGDALVAVAYHSLLETRTPRLSEIVQEFTDGLLEVCEGQTFDMEFEESNDVSVDDYLLMIEKKTGALLKMSAVVGGIAGNATRKQLVELGNFGRNIGLAFQIRDDLLDIKADKGKFGKPMYNDIKTGKRTYLLLYAHGKADRADKRILKKVFRRTVSGSSDIEKVVDLYEKKGAFSAAEEAVTRYTTLARRSLSRLPDGKGKKRLELMAEMLVGRDY